VWRVALSSTPAPITLPAFLARTLRNQRLVRTTITRYASRSLVQPPNQLTRQSPNREPIVTGVRRRRNLVSSCMELTTSGQHIHPSEGPDSQVENLEAGCA
jgi:hypothetical protein